MIDCLVEPPQVVYPSICCRTRHGRAWARAWHGMGLGMVKGMSRGAVGQGIILSRYPIGREWSSASNATGRGKVRRLVPDQAQANGRSCCCLLLHRQGWVDSCRLLSLLPSLHKTPSSLLQSQPIFSPFQFLTPGQASQPLSNQPIDPSPAVLCVVSVVASCLVATCRCFQVLVALHPDPKSCARPP